MAVVFEFNIKTPTATLANNSQPSVSKKSGHNNTNKRKAEVHEEESIVKDEIREEDISTQVDESFILDDPVTKEEALELIREIYRRSEK